MVITSMRDNYSPSKSQILIYGSYLKEKAATIVFVTA